MSAASMTPEQSPPQKQSSIRDFALSRLTFFPLAKLKKETEVAPSHSAVAGFSLRWLTRPHIVSNAGPITAHPLVLADF